MSSFTRAHSPDSLIHLFYTLIDFLALLGGLSEFRFSIIHFLQWTLHGTGFLIFHLMDGWQKFVFNDFHDTGEGGRKSLIDKNDQNPFTITLCIAVQII